MTDRRSVPERSVRLQIRRHLAMSKNYYEERGIQQRETVRLTVLYRAVSAIRRTTGQHPGGIVVLPVGEEI